jgi:hypothetical protein
VLAHTTSRSLGGRILRLDELACSTFSLAG